MSLTDIVGHELNRAAGDIASDYVHKTVQGVAGNIVNGQQQQQSQPQNFNADIQGAASTLAHDTANGVAFQAAKKLLMIPCAILAILGVLMLVLGSTSESYLAFFLGIVLVVVAFVIDIKGTAKLQKKFNYYDKGHRLI